MQEIGVRELKNRLTAVMREVRESGVEYTVTLHGKPVAVIRPLGGPDEPTRAAAVAGELAAIKSLAARLASLGDEQPLRATLTEMREETPWR